MTAPPAAAVMPASPPAPSLPPPGANWARVRQAAQADGIGVPLASDPPFDTSSASPQARMLVGAWGPGTWQGSAGGEKLMLIVLGVDGGTTVRGVVARSGGINWAYYNAPLAGNRFTAHITSTYEASGLVSSTRTMEDENWQFDLRPDGTLYGSRNGSTIVLARLQ